LIAVLPGDLLNGGLVGIPGVH